MPATAVHVRRFPKQIERFDCRGIRFDDNGERFDHPVVMVRPFGLSTRWQQMLLTQELRGVPLAMLKFQLNLQ